MRSSSHLKKSRRGAYSIVESAVMTPFLLMCGYVTGIMTGGPIGMSIALLVVILVLWRFLSRRVSTEGHIVSLYGWGPPRRFSEVVEVSAVRSEVGAAGLPVSSVAVVLAGGQRVELGILRGIPILRFGDVQARRSTAWLAGRLGMVQVDEDTWRLPPPEIL